MMLALVVASVFAFGSAEAHAPPDALDRADSPSQAEDAASSMRSPYEYLAVGLGTGAGTLGAAGALGVAYAGVVVLEWPALLWLAVSATAVVLVPLFVGLCVLGGLTLVSPRLDDVGWHALTSVAASAGAALGMIAGGATGVLLARSSIGGDDCGCTVQGIMIVVGSVLAGSVLGGVIGGSAAVLLQPASTMGGVWESDAEGAEVAP